MNNKEQPLISILLATYNPNLKWLRQQLISLNNQTYTNIELFVCDDYSDKVSYVDIENLVEECITSFSFYVERNKENLGTCLTFQNLTLKVKGEYIAYCDQDDVWFMNKIEQEYKAINEMDAKLVYTDLVFTDSHLNIITDSRKKYYNQDLLSGGKEIEVSILNKNCVAGCTILIDANFAKLAIPFCPYMFYDHYLSLYTTINSKIYALKKPTLYYRRHIHVQTGINILQSNKKDYKKTYIDESILCYEWLKTNIKCDEIIFQEFASLLDNAKARHDLFQKGIYTKEIAKEFNIVKSRILFERYSRFIPDKLFEVIIKTVNFKNILFNCIKQYGLMLSYLLNNKIDKVKK